MHSGLHDAQLTGLFIVSSLDVFYDKEIIGILSESEKAGNPTILITYNPVAAVQQGNLALRVVRLSERFLSLNGVITTDALTEKGIKYNNIFEDIPFSICNPGLVHAYLFDFVQGDLLSISHNTLNPLPTTGATTLIDTLTSSNPNGYHSQSHHSTPTGMLEQYSYLVERYQREMLSQSRYKTEYETRLTNIHRENAIRAKQGLTLLPEPEKPHVNENTTLDLYLLASHIKSLAASLGDASKLISQKQGDFVKALSHINQDNENINKK